MSKSQCGNCERVWEDDKLEDVVGHVESRMEPGDTYPSGECRDCGALCTPVEEARPQPITVDYEMLNEQRATLCDVLDVMKRNDCTTEDQDGALTGIEFFLAEIIHQRPFPEPAGA